jgi:thiosulfate dehydrogenase [quinone] large subunit
MKKRELSANDYGMAWLRIAIGILFLIFAQYKILETKFVDGGGFDSWIHRFLAGGAYPFMAPLLRDFVLPHAHVLALVVAYGELCIGLALVAGILVKPAGFFGFLYMLILLFSSNYPGAQAPVWEYFGAALNHLVLALCFLAFEMSDAGRVWSLPAYVRRRYIIQRRTESAQEADLPSGASNVFGK